MFWKFNLLTTSHVDTLLDKEDVTLTELMDEDDILQECKAQNRKLVDFLARPEYMEEMVRLITVEPPDDVDEKIRFKYPNTACELLTADVSQINEKLAGDEELVNKLYSFLEGPKPLNPLLASFFSKVMGLLITRKSEMIFEYLKSKDDFVGRLLHHIGTSAVMDLLLRLITCIESVDTRKAVIEWLNKENIVIRLVDSIVVLKEEDIHCNAAQSLCDIVRLGREQFIQQQEAADPDPLLFTMEQEETVSRLLSNMFNSNKNESVLVNGLCVIHTLLEIRKQGAELCDHLPNGETDRFTQGISNVIAALIPRLKDFHDLLINPPKQFYNSMPTSCGCLDPPLGNTRLQVAKLITALVGTNMHQVNLELASLGTIQTLMDLCFKYEWNNFLHTQIEQCLLLILNNGPIEIDGKLKSPLLTQLFTEYNLIQRILSEWEGNEQQNTKNRKRRGFMGHLTKMANCISGLLEKNDTTNLVKDYFGGLSQEVKDRWDAFVAGSLADVNKKNMIELMRGHPLVSSSEDDDADFKDIPFPQDSTMQQAFADFQLQQMTSNFIDQFGFNDEEFADQEGKIEANFAGKISSIGADFQANVNQASAVFEQVCRERSQQIDDDSDEDIWEEKPITFDKTAQHARLERLQGATARCNSSDEDSTDSGEELDSPVKITQQPAEGMDVDNSEGQWCADSSSQSEHTAMDIAYSPWEKPSPATAPTTTTTSTSTASEGWADFSELPSQSENEENWADFSNFSELQSSVAQEPRMSSPVEMDTYESTRGNQYVVSSNSDSQTPSVSASATVTLQGASEMCVTDLEDDETINPQPDSTSSSLPATKTLGSSDSIVVNNNSRQHPTQTTPPALSLHFTARTAQSVESSSTDSQVSSTSESVSENSNDSRRLQPASSMAVHTSSSSSSSDQLATTPTSEVGSSASDASVANLNTGVSSSHQIVMAGGSLDNQSFLTSTGLMKRPSATASRSWPSSESQRNGPVTSTAVLPMTSTPQLAHTMSNADGDSGSQEPDTTQCSLTSAQRIELARTEGTEAQELLDASTGVLQNGPV